jgi:PEP-CTERM motif
MSIQKRPPMRPSRVLLATAALLICGHSVWSATTVTLGTVTPISGPGDLDLTGDIRYAVHFGPNNPFTLTVNGVPFQSDTTFIPGASFVGPQAVGAPGWQTKPEFGGTADEDALEIIYQDIRWSQTGVDPPLQANLDVTSGDQYKLQILFYGNWDGDNRRWDVMVEGVPAVDEIVSLGISNAGELPAYSPNRGLVYTYDFTAPDSQVNVMMGSLFGDFDGGDRNPIWQGLTLERIPEPAAITLSGLGLLALLRRRRGFD